MEFFLTWRWAMESISAVELWAGRVLSGIAVAFLLFDAAGKIMKVAPVVKGTVELGYPESVVLPLGVLLLIGVVLYVFPGTSVPGAVYLTAFLGGAVATHVRAGSPLVTHVLFPVYVAAFVWGGLALRNPRLVALLTGGR
jgi:hypothetical protein